jgi:hypothetical protein
MTHDDNLALIADVARTEPVALVDGIAFLFNCDEVEVCTDTGAVTIIGRVRGGSRVLDADDIARVAQRLRAGDL